jgi:asparagine synthase (glutamine-hydrolysing)
MVESLRHRGPDDEGVFIDEGIGLGHSRLSIIDLTSAGRQPMMSEDQRYSLVFNGEIYNFRELRERYCSDVSFKSNSDSEVLLHMLIKQGEAALSELRGMFALAFWDKEKSRLLLARDPFGKKPLYYSVKNNNFLFASEIKALLKHSLVGGEINKEKAVKYFIYESVPSIETGFKDIQQVPMGHYLVVTNNNVEVKKWWAPSFTPKQAVLSENEAMNEFDKRMKMAVERRMIADVPVGLLLSGGLDSTTIGWYMKQATTAPVHSFSVSFEEKSFNESDFAQKAAKALSTEHHDLQFGLNEFHQTLKEVVEKMDIPFGDASLLPTYAVSKLAREHITVALDGDGSDELLGGYGTFKAAELSEKIPKLSADAWRWLERAAGRLPTDYGYFSFDFKLKSFLKGMAYRLPFRNQIWLGPFSERELKELLTPAWQSGISGVFDDIFKLEKEVLGLKTTDQISLFTIRHYLNNDILVKLDRASMLVSLEARTPFLDVDLAEYVMKLPVRYKKDKYLLKNVMRGRIPDEIIDRKKQGFAIPLGYWLRGPLYDWAGDVLNEDKLKSDGVFDVRIVKRLLDEHKDGRADHRKKLWTLLMWQTWWDKWVKEKAT